MIPLLLAGSCEKDKPLVTGDPNPYYRIMFYNVENLFDAEDDLLTNDEEFMPDSEKEWTDFIYRSKGRNKFKISYKPVRKAFFKKPNKIACFESDFNINKNIDI